MLTEMLNQMKVKRKKLIALKYHIETKTDFQLILQLKT